MEAKKGLVVKAVAGRDKDSFFVITEAEKSFVMIADGKSRPLDRPKRKNIKHLRATGSVLCIDEITNKKLRRALSEYSKLTKTESGGK